MDSNHRLPLCRRGTLAGLSYASKTFGRRTATWAPNHRSGPAVTSPAAAAPTLLVAEARIELACAAYGTALEPLQALRNKLAGEVGFEPTASALTVRHSATEL